LVIAELPGGSARILTLLGIKTLAFKTLGPFFFAHKGCFD